MFCLFINKIKNKHTLIKFHLNLIKQKLDILKIIIYHIPIENLSRFNKLNIHNIKYLNFIKETFVICPLDKASNSFTCRKFYLITLAKEKGIISENGTLKISSSNQTYETYDKESELANNKIKA